MANMAAVRMFRNRGYHGLKTHGSSKNAFENVDLAYFGD
jgi:hypothetical protein